MSTYVLMKILESAPDRYDRGIRILTLGRLDAAYDRLTANIRNGQTALDIGCGTGALTLRAARKGAFVKGIDVNPQMLEIARMRADEAGLSETIELCEMGVAEIGKEATHGYDIAMSGMCFSELSEDEIAYTLKELRRILKLGGILLIADEAMPAETGRRILSRLLRFPLVLLTYVVTQTTTSAVRNLPEKVITAGFELVSVRMNRLHNFLELTARNPKKRVLE